MLRQNLNVSQRQQLTIQPSMLQLVKFLTLTQLELKDVITEEVTANPALEELDANVPLPEEIEAMEPAPDHAAERIAAATEEVSTAPAEERKDPFDEIDFPSWEEYLDPGYRSRQEMETIERPSFENFLSRPTTLTDHLFWQLGALPLREEVVAAAEEIIGNLDEEGRLTASDDELMGLVPATAGKSREAEELSAVASETEIGLEVETGTDQSQVPTAEIPLRQILARHASATESHTGMATAPALLPTPVPRFSLEALHEALAVVRHMDPLGVGARDLRECMLAQLEYLRGLLKPAAKGQEPPTAHILADAIAIADKHIDALGKKRYKEIAKAIGRPIEAVQLAEDTFISKLDPRPGLRYNRVETRLIEPDVFFVKHGDEYHVLMNEDDLPQLRLSPQYRHLMTRDTEKETRNYVKEHYKSALQLIKNIEQRKHTIQKVCQCILVRQRDFLDHGIAQLKPMMIKDVAEEIGVHASTVSRAVSNKYAHTQQGVYELRYFFSEGSRGEKGGDISLINVKLRVKKLIDTEDTAHPLTDDQLTDQLRTEGVAVTRRTVAKYREDMRIPSTHQRRKKTK